MSASRVYTLGITELTGTGLTFANPFAQLSTPSTMAIEIMGIRLGQRDSETSQQLAIQIARRSTASTLPTATTPKAINQRDPASLLTGSTTTNAIGLASVVGTIGDILEPGICFNSLTGLLWLPPEAMRITMQISSFLTVHFVGETPAAGIFNGAIYFRELF